MKIYKKVRKNPGKYRAPVEYSATVIVGKKHITIATSKSKEKIQRILDGFNNSGITDEELYEKLQVVNGYREGIY